MMSLEVSFFDGNPVGRLVNRITNDIESLNEMFSSVLNHTPAGSPYYRKYCHCHVSYRFAPRIDCKYHISRFCKWFFSSAPVPGKLTV